MKNRLLYFSTLILIGLSTSAFASAKLKKGGLEADPGKPAELSSHFTLPIGFPVSLSSHDSAFDNTKRDSAGNVIKGRTLARKKIYQVSIADDNSVSGWRQTEEAFRQAQDMNADYILIHVDDDNAYSTANKIRNQLYHYKTPVLLYVENKNKSNKSIIPLTADTLAQLRQQANAAAHFPNGPYDNSKSKKENANAEKRPYIVSLGKKCEWNENLNYANTGPNTNASSSVTKTLSEAGINNVDIINYHPTPIGKLIDNLSGLFFSLALMLLIICGLYFEMRSIGKGLAMFISVCASLLLFASHYFENNNDGWYALLFVTGVILLCRDVYFSVGGVFSSLLGSFFVMSSFVLCLIGSDGILISILSVSTMTSIALFLSMQIERKILNLNFISATTDPNVSLSPHFSGGTLITTI